MDKYHYKRQAKF